MAEDDWADKRAREWLSLDYPPAKWHPDRLQESLANLLREVWEQGFHYHSDSDAE